MWVNYMYLGHENFIILDTKYDENLLLPLLTEANKLLMFNRAKIAFDLHSQVDYEGFFSHQNNNYKHIHGHFVKGTFGF